MWYRIELNKDGGVRSCVEVSGSLLEGRSVHYVEADSKESAIAILAKQWDKYCLRKSEKQKARFAKRLAQGFCPRHPNNVVAQGLKKCDVCRERDRNKAPIVSSRKPPLTDVERAERRIKERAQSKACNLKYREKLRVERRAIKEKGSGVYIEVLHQWETLSAEQFRAWLESKITGLVSEQGEAAE